MGTSNDFLWSEGQAVDEPVREFDTAWKQALEWFFEPFLGFFFPIAHADIDWSTEPEFFDKELQQIVP